MPRALRPLVLVAAFVAAPVAGGQLPAGARAEGLAALPSLLQFVDSADLDLALRARRTAKEIVTEWHRGQTPPGMCLVPGSVELSCAGVRVDGGFYLAMREVTIGEYALFLSAQGERLQVAAALPDLPLTMVSLDEARAYAAWKGARLPTSEELRAAASGCGVLAYPWGNEFDPRRANTRELGLGRPEPVGSRPLGDSPEGISDLLGNVAEWTETCVGDGRRARWLAVGGSFDKALGSPGSATHRLRADARLPDVGFRLALSLPPLPQQGAAPAAAD
ncbi:MAG: formylglycine-generating enzyme family protein [Planctomycetaceae bacterium]